MSFRRAFAFFLIAATLLTAGCPRKFRPNPGDTVTGGGSANSGQDANWQGGYSVDGDPALAGTGLENQDAGSMDAANQVRGLLPSVYFDFDQAFVRPGERPKLDQAASHLQANPNDRLLLEGHCDWRGTTEYNLALGERRAQSVREYLATLGISADRIQTVSKGDLEATEGGGEAQLQQDRRADLVIVRQ